MRIFLVLLFALSASVRGDFQFPGTLHTREDLEFANQKARSGREPWKAARQQLLAEAERALLVEPEAPDTYLVPARYGDDAAGHERERQRLATQARAAYALALASWFAEPDRAEQYALHAAAILSEWTKCSDMGAADGSPFERRETALVTCTSGAGLLLAADLLMTNPVWSGTERARFLEWTRTVLGPASAIKTISYQNNWNAWGVYFSLLRNHLLQDQAGFNSDRDLWESDVFHHIQEDGKMPKELERGSGKNWYTYYALVPITAAAVVIRNNTGEDLLSAGTPSGQRVKAGLDYFFENLKGHDYRSLIEATGDLYRDREFLEWNLGTRPVTGHAGHTGWVFPSLFVRWEELPVNHPPTIQIEPVPELVSVGTPVRFDASKTTDPDDGDELRFIWVMPGRSSEAKLDEPLMSAGDRLYFPSPSAGPIEVAFDLLVDVPGDTVIGLQPSTMSGSSWRASVFQISVNQGEFKGRDGKDYRSVEPAVAEPGVRYRVRMAADATTGRFCAWVRPAEGGSEVQIADNFAARDGVPEFMDIAKLIYSGRVGVVVDNVEVKTSGSTLMGPVAETVFTEPGSQIVRLTVTDSHGTRSISESSVEVK